MWRSTSPTTPTGSWRTASRSSRRAAGSDSRFALLMGDHLFEARVLRQLLLAPVEPGESLLAVDSRPTAPEIADEATKVRLRGSRIIAIGKTLTEYDALDTGLFVCAPSLFGALESARAAGRYDAERRHQNTRRAGPDAFVRRRRRDVVRHRHHRGSAQRRIAARHVPIPAETVVATGCTEMTTEARHSAIRLGALALGVALFAGALYYINVGTTLEIVRRLGIALPLVLVLSGLWHLARTWAWAECFPQPRQVGFLRLARVRLAAEAFSYLTFRGMAGEPLKVVLLSGSIDARQATAAVALERLAYLVGTTIIVGVGAVVRTDRPAVDAAVVPRLPSVCDWLRRCHRS